MRTLIEQLQQAVYAFTQQLYQTQQPQAGPQPGGNGNGSGRSNGQGRNEQDEGVVEGEFNEL